LVRTWNGTGRYMKAEKLHTDQAWVLSNIQPLADVEISNPVTRKASLAGTTHDRNVRRGIGDE